MGVTCIISGGHRGGSDATLEGYLKQDSCELPSRIKEAVITKLGECGWFTLNRTWECMCQC